MQLWCSVLDSAEHYFLESAQHYFTPPLLIGIRFQLYITNTRETKMRFRLQAENHTKNKTNNRSGIAFLSATFMNSVSLQLVLSVISRVSIKQIRTKITTFTEFSWLHWCDRGPNTHLLSTCADVNNPQKRIDMILAIYRIGNTSRKLKESHRIVYRFNPNSLVLYRNVTVFSVSYFYIFASAMLFIQKSGVWQFH